MDFLPPNMLEINSRNFGFFKEKRRFDEFYYITKEIGTGQILFLKLKINIVDFFKYKTQKVRLEWCMREFS